MNDSTNIRILVADDHRLFRSGVISLLEDEPNIFVVGEAENGEELINLYSELRPDVVLIDISMPFLTGTEALKEIKKEDPNVRALFVSMHDTEEYIYFALKHKAAGLISKNIMKGELIYAIKRAYEGKQYFGQSWPDEKLREVMMRFEYLTGKNSQDTPNLTPREREILRRIGFGLTSQEIANKLKLSKRTIDSHRSHIMKKLGVNSLSELIKYAVKFNQMDKLD
ncbi:MAG: response regulator transcription factor [Ignavibacteria bacterium]|jgi:two-component system response regulator NreC